MEDNRLKGAFDKQRENGERKHSNSHKDVKRKLSFINKKIIDLQHQRKIAYKNSSKVKRMVHNQVNQIVKCLRARERNIWSDIDEAYLLQDENINEELLRLQSVHACCQTLFDHLDDNKGNIRILDKIYTILSGVNLNEKPNGKALEFTSEFETMKTMATCFGNLNGDFIKRDEFVLIDEKEHPFNLVCKTFSDKKEYLEKTLDNIETEDCKNELPTKSALSEDSFEIVDFVEHMSCDEFEKDLMAEQDVSERKALDCRPIENVNLPHGNGSEFLKVPNSFEKSQSQMKSNDFNPEEEWQQLYELKNRIGRYYGKLDDSFENKSCEIQGVACNYLKADKNCKRYACLSPKELKSWLQDSTLTKDKISKKCTSQYVNFLAKENMLLNKKSLEMDELRMTKSFDRLNITLKPELSPAELIQKAFTPYLAKEGIENWISNN